MKGPPGDSESAGVSSRRPPSLRPGKEPFLPITQGWLLAKSREGRFLQLPGFLEKEEEFFQGYH